MLGRLWKNDFAYRERYHGRMTTPWKPDRRLPTYRILAMRNLLEEAAFHYIVDVFYFSQKVGLQSPVSFTSSRLTARAELRSVRDSYTFQSSSTIDSRFYTKVHQLCYVPASLRVLTEDVSNSSGPLGESSKQKR